MWWKPKHTTLNLSAASTLPDQEPHSAAWACFHLCTALKWKNPSNYWLDIAGVSYRNKYYLGCVREWLNTREHRAAGERVISNLTFHMLPGQAHMKIVPHLSISDMPFHTSSGLSYINLMLLSLSTWTQNTAKLNVGREESHNRISRTLLLEFTKCNVIMYTTNTQI